MLKNINQKQRVKILASKEHKYSEREGVYHYQDREDPDWCVVTFGDGISTYFLPEELESMEKTKEKP